MEQSDEKIYAQDDSKIFSQITDIDELIWSQVLHGDENVRVRQTDIESVSEGSADDESNSQ